MQINSAIQRFLDNLYFSQGRSLKTVRTYASILKKFAEFVGENQGLEGINQDVINQFIKRLRENNYRQNSIVLALCALKSFFNFLRKGGVISQNPLPSIRTQYQKSLPVFLDEQQVETLLNLPDESTTLGIRDKAILEILYSTGIRAGELCSLDVDDVNLSNLTLKVRGKGGKERIVPFGQRAFNALTRYLQVRKAENQALFVSKSGRRLKPYDIYRVVSAYIKRVADIPRKGPHILRHSFATHLINNGADIKIIKELLGHSNIHTTEVYAHVSIKHLQEVYGKYHPHALIKN